MNIFSAIYDFIQAVRQAVIDVLTPIVLPDWAWLINVVLPLAFFGLVLLYFVYLVMRIRRNAWANLDRRPPRLQGRVVPPPGVHASPPSWWPIELSVGFFFLLLGYVAASVPLLAVGVVVLLIGALGWIRSANRELRQRELAPEHGAGAHAISAGAATAALPAGTAPGAVPVSRAVVPAGPTAVVPSTGVAAEHAAEAPPGVHMPAPSWWPVYASLAAFFGLLGLIVNAALLAGGIVLAILAVVGWYVDAYRELRVAEGIAPRPHIRDPRQNFPRILATIGGLTVFLSIAFAVGPRLVGGILPAPSGSPGASGAACTPPATIEITAKGTKFSTDTLCLPANTAFKLVFHNEDAGVQHDVNIGTVFNGAVFEGPADKTYDVPALPPGQYKFICIVHPTVMFGTATVVASGSTPGGSPGASAPGGSSPGGSTPSATP